MCLLKANQPVYKTDDQPITNHLPIGLKKKTHWNDPRHIYMYITHFEQLGRLERPFHLTTQALHVDPTGYVDASGQLTDVLSEGDFKCHITVHAY